MGNNLLASDRLSLVHKKIEKVFEKYAPSLDHNSYLHHIAKSENIAVEEADLADVSGMLMKRDGVWKIVVNRYDSPKRKLFTMAHELGHYFLHREYSSSFIDGSMVETFHRDESEKYEQMELEANEFAGSLIMPVQFIEKDIDKNKPVSVEKVEKMAQLFGVSAIAMFTRLKNLEYDIV